MLTLKMLKEMPPKTVFATGTIQDSPLGLNMTRSGKMLRWVAERGIIHDWTIYCHWEFHDVEWIRRHGDKVCSDENIKRLVSCNDEAFAMYRF